MYTGPYVHPGRRVNVPTEVDNHLEALREGVFVAIALEGYNKIPVIGKVLKVNEHTVKICYWKGSWRTAWSPWMQGNVEWTDELLKSCVLLVDFKLDHSNKLESETVKYLRKAYQNVKDLQKQ